VEILVPEDHGAIYGYLNLWIHYFAYFWVIMDFIFLGKIVLYTYFFLVSAFCKLYVVYLLTTYTLETGFLGNYKNNARKQNTRGVEVICKDTEPCLPDVGAHDNVIGIRSGSHAMTRFSGP